MGMHTIDVRGFEIVLEAKSGSQLRLIKSRMAERTDDQLAQYVEESEQESLNPVRIIPPGGGDNREWDLFGEDIPEKYRARLWGSVPMSEIQWLGFARGAANREFGITPESFSELISTDVSTLRGTNGMPAPQIDTSIVPESWVRAIAWRCNWYPAGRVRKIRELWAEQSRTAGDSHA